MSGFPTWTLFGMGISAALAVLFTAMAYLAQSPNLLVRFRMAGSRLAQSGRRLTGLGLASTLLGAGFFMAGVPLGDTTVDNIDSTSAIVEESEGQSSSVDPTEPDAVQPAEIGSIVEDDATLSEDPTTETGSFGSQPAVDEETSDEVAESTSNASGAFSQPAEATAETAVIVDTATPALATNTPVPTGTPRPTDTPTATRTPTSTPTPSPTPTNTPTPTVTPTAIKGDTVTVSFDGEITWVYRVPGNQRLELVNNGDQLLPESGRAMIAGITWQEVRLLDGRPGWIQLNRLDVEDN